MSKIHLLGVGSMGSLLAHEVVKAHPSINKNFTLLFKNLATVDAFKNQDSKLIINKSDNTSSFSTFHSDHQLHRDEIIQNLILATKAHQTESAIHKYRNNISPQTNILLVQNGMGMLDHLNTRFWPNSEERPQLYQCISTHGAFKSSPFICNHVGMGRLDIAKFRPSSAPLDKNQGDEVAEQEQEKEEEEVPEFINLITSSSSLNARYIDYPHFLLNQIEKLVVNTCINPLTAIFDCKNGELLYTSTLPKMMKRIIREDIRVLKAELPILETMPETETVLNEERLLQSVIKVCQITANNSSSMREDVRLLKNTEIYWINGYIARLGIKHSIPTLTNSMVQDMVKEKLAISRGIERNSVNTIISKLHGSVR